MIDPIAVGLSIEYVIEKDRASNNPTTWIIGSMDSFTQSKLLASLIDITVKDGDVAWDKSSNKQHPDFTIVKYGLKGWKNFGKLEFRSEKVSLFGQEIESVPDDLLKQIPLPIVQELALVIWKGNQVSEDLKKN